MLHVYNTVHIRFVLVTRCAQHDNALRSAVVSEPGDSGEGEVRLERFARNSTEKPKIAGKVLTSRVREGGVRSYFYTYNRVRGT